MAVSGTLYTYPDNFRAQKALIAAHFSGAKVKVVSEAPDFVYGETNKNADFMKKFSSGEVPAFESTDGKVHLTEANAIAHYLASAKLRGETPEKQAEILQWTNFSQQCIVPSVVALYLQAQGHPVPNVDEKIAKEELKKALTALNTHLGQRKNLVGDEVTLADIVVFADLLPGLTEVIDDSFQLPNITKWFQTLSAQEHFKTVVKDVKLKTTAGAKGAGDQAGTKGQEGGKKEKKEKVPKEEKPKTEEKPKKEEKKKVAKEEEDDDDQPDLADEAMAAEPKEKDPFQALPPGTFKMDDWKRVYSNEDTISKAIPYFWDNFDPENYSVWMCEYKYPQELKQVFMTCNLITGFFQRLEKMAKQAFGSVILFGSDNNSTISGVWIWRGHDLAFNLSPNWQVDNESYDWKKLDPKDEKTKKMVNEYWAWEGDFEGKKFNQGKIFK